MLGQPGIVSTSSVLGQMNDTVSSDQVMAEIVGEKVSSVSSQTCVLEGHGLLIESDHVNGNIGVIDETTNRSSSDSTRCPGHHNRKHCHTMPS